MMVSHVQSFIFQKLADPSTQAVVNRNTSIVIRVINQSKNHSKSSKQGDFLNGCGYVLPNFVIAQL
jgi:subtilase family serine protease